MIYSGFMTHQRGSFTPPFRGVCRSIRTQDRGARWAVGHGVRAGGAGEGAEVCVHVVRPRVIHHRGRLQKPAEHIGRSTSVEDEDEDCLEDKHKQQEAMLFHAGEEHSVLAHAPGWGRWGAELPSRGGCSTLWATSLCRPPPPPSPPTFWGGSVLP